MNALASMNSGNAVKSALSGVQRMAVGGGRRVPSFGAAQTASPTRAAPMGSLGPGNAPASVQDLLSRPKRTVRSGWTKTSTIKGGAAPIPPGGAAGAGPGTGGGY